MVSPKIILINLKLFLYNMFKFYNFIRLKEEDLKHPFRLNNVWYENIF